ncbi:MAG: hypothetical protein CMO79_07085 [Verrucomicrobiales bacterium]|nr:hypothetical protein [Verrucomicrobiales bacterium]
MEVGSSNLPGPTIFNPFLQGFFRFWMVLELVVWGHFRANKMVDKKTQQDPDESNIKRFDQQRFLVDRM